MFRKKVTDIQILESILDLISVGISGQQAVRKLSQVIKDPAMAYKLGIVADYIETEGYTMADAMREAGMLSKYTDILDMGQRTGSIEKVMREVIVTSREIGGIVGKVKSSLYYPVGVVVFSIVVAYGITFVIEKIIGALASPVTMNYLGFKVASFIVAHRNAIVFGYVTVLLAVAYAGYKNIQKLPGIGKMYNSIILGQAFRMFSLGMASGMSTAKSFEFSAKMLTGKWREVFEVMADDAATRNLSDMVDDIEEFLDPESYLILKMKIDTGNIGDGFGSVGSRYITNAIRQLEGVSSLASMFATILVAVQVVAMMSPIFMMIGSFMDSVSAFGTKGF